MPGKMCIRDSSYYPQGSNAQTADRTTFAFNATIEESDVEPMLSLIHI